MERSRPICTSPGSRQNQRVTSRFEKRSSRLWASPRSLMGKARSTRQARRERGGRAAMSEHITSQAKFYTIPVAIAFGAAFLLLLLVPLLKSLTRSVKA